MTVEPSDVVWASYFATDALAPAIGRDWSVRAGSLEWDVDRTLTHLAGAPAKHALYLASRSTRFIAVRMAKWLDASQAECIDAIRGTARALAGVAEAAPAGTRAFHARGMFDVSGFCATDCVELLVHGYDVAQGLGLPYDPPDDFCDRVAARVFPWREPAGWSTLLDATGRGAERFDDDWPALATPLDEWDGTIPTRDPRPVIAWTNEDGRWVPTYLD